MPRKMDSVTKLERLLFEFNSTTPPDVDERKKKGRYRESQRRYRYRKRHSDKTIDLNRRYYHRHRDAIIERKRQYYQQHRDKIKENVSLYYQKHKDEIRKKHSAYYQHHRDKLTVHKRQYYQQNKERIRGTQRQYYQKHKDDIRMRQRLYRQKGFPNIETIFSTGYVIGDVQFTNDQLRITIDEPSEALDAKFVVDDFMEAIKPYDVNLSFGYREKTLVLSSASTSKWGKVRDMIFLKAVKSAFEENYRKVSFE